MVAGNPAAGQQPGAGGGGFDDPPGHPVPVDPRRPDRRQAVGRPAVLRCTVHSVDGGADGGDGGRRDRALERHPEPMAAGHAHPGADRQRRAGADRRLSGRRFRLAGADHLCPGRVGHPRRCPRHPRQVGGTGRLPVHFRRRQALRRAELHFRQGHRASGREWPRDQRPAPGKTPVHRAAVDDDGSRYRRRFHP
ncbi:hypothetical protein D3C79_810470 [compost metagenome]